LPEVVVLALMVALVVIGIVVRGKNRREHQKGHSLNESVSFRLSAFRHVRSPLKQTQNEKSGTAELTHQKTDLFREQVAGHALPRDRRCRFKRKQLKLNSSEDEKGSGSSKKGISALHREAGQEIQLETFDDISRLFIVC
jgi:hypothetical protein